MTCRVGAPARALLLTLALLAPACGSDSNPAPPTGPPTGPQHQNVTSITDGDTVRFSPALSGLTSLRFLNIDAPELGAASQEPWAAASRANMQQLLPVGAEIAIETDQQRTDSFGRLLGHAVRPDGVNVNREQLRMGHAVLFVIWPNMAHFTEYRGAQLEAQNAARGVWSTSTPLRELPFEYRLRQDREAPFRPVGDVSTRQDAALP